MLLLCCLADTDTKAMHNLSNNVYRFKGEAGPPGGGESRSSTPVLRIR
jgi:hypothetical protein